jgi:hypothetical protein
MRFFLRCYNPGQVLTAVKAVTPADTAESDSGLAIGGAVAGWNGGE